MKEYSKEDRMTTTTKKIMGFPAAGWSVEEG